MLGRCRLNRAIDCRQRVVRSRQINLRLTHRSADVAGDVEIEIVLFDLRHLDPAGVARLLFAELVGLDDLGDVLGPELVLRCVNRPCATDRAVTEESSATRFRRSI